MPQPNAYFWGLQSPSREIKMIFGSFAPAGTGSPTDAKGDGWSAARTAEGVFTVTFTHNWKDLIACGADLRLDASADSVAQVGTYVAASRTLLIRTLTAGSDDDIAADADNRVNFWAAFKRTTTTPLSTATVS